MAFDIAKVLEDFPATGQEINGHQLVYLDSAASALKPRQVVDSISQHYLMGASNVHRGIHSLSAQATTEFESGRRNVQKFINAKEDREIIFTKGTTESVNLVAQAWGEKNLKEGDEIILSEMEHHSNLVPWQMLAEKKRLILKYIPVLENGELDLEFYKNILNEKTKLVAISHGSNTLGTVNPIKQISKEAHAKNALVLVDGAQAVTCRKVDVQDLDCDFYAFSGHKVFGPTGVGVLFGKADILEKMPPYQGGGSMISEVSLEGVTYNDIPFRFEAGTPPIAQVIGLSSAIDYVKNLGWDSIYQHEEELLVLATKELEQIEGLKILGASKNKAPLISFVIEGVHANDIGEILDQQGIAVRTGHHCTQPLMKRFGVNSTVRASFSIYNTKEDVSRLIAGVKKAKEMLL